MYVQRVLFKGVPSINGARGMWRGEGGGVKAYFPPSIKPSSYVFVQLFVGYSIGCGWSVGLSVSHYFLKGQEVTLPCSYRSALYKYARINFHDISFKSV